MSLAQLPLASAWAESAEQHTARPELRQRHGQIELAAVDLDAAADAPGRFLWSAAGRWESGPSCAPLAAGLDAAGLDAAGLDAAGLDAADLDHGRRAARRPGRRTPGQRRFSRMCVALEVWPRSEGANRFNA